MSTGIFGSGTASAPSITFSGDLNTGIYSPLANEIAITTNGTGRLFVDSIGRVGIGTSNPTDKFDLVDFLGVSVKLKGGSDDRAQWRIFVSDNGSAGLLQIADFSGGSYTTNVTLLSDGKVGIGTSSPTQKIDLEDSNGARIAFTDTGTRRYSMGNAGTALTIRDESGSADRLTIKDNGSVGIGTSDPNSLFEIAASSPVLTIRSTDTSITTADATLRLAESGSGGTVDNYWDLVADQTVNNFGFSIKENGTDRLNIAAGTGNVGIGTNNPNTKLHLAAATPIFTIEDTSGATAGVEATCILRNNDAFELQNRNSNNTFNDTFYAVALDANGASQHTWKTGNTERMRLDSDGNVGIGTSNPQVALDLEGQTNTTFTQGFNVRLTDNRTAAKGVGAGISFRGKWNTAAPTAVADFAVITGIKENNTNGNYAGALVFGTRTAGSGAVNTERMRIDSTGRLLVGVSSAVITGNSIVPQIQLEGLSTVSSGSLSAILNRSADSLGPRFVLTKTRGTSKGSTTIVQNGDELGNLYFCGADGTDLATVGAQITAAVDGTPGTNDMPGRLVFSTTAATNSNPTERMRITSTGNVGIGTSSPAVRLHVDGGNNVNNILVSSTNSSSYITFADTNTTSNSQVRVGSIGDGMRILTGGSDSMRIDSSGNVGIGTTNPQQLLEISSGGPRLRITDNNTTAATSTSYIEFQGSNARAAVIYTNSGGLNLQADSSGGNNIRFLTNGAANERMRITSSGKVGIGTSSPGPVLDVRDGVFANNQDFGIQVGLPTGQWLGKFGIKSDGSGVPRIAIGYPSDNSGTITEAISIQNNGRVGIGTSSPATELEVVSTSPTIASRATGNNTGKFAVNSNRAANLVGGQIFGQWNGNNVSSINFVNGADGTNKDDGEISFLTSSSNSNPTEAMRIASDGNVGIGTTNPQYKLEVDGDIKLPTTGTIWFDDSPTSTEKIKAGSSSIDIFADATVNFYESDGPTFAFTIDTNSARAYFAADSNTYWYRPAADEHAWTTAGSERLRIDSSGFVGIGTSTPASDLHVQSNTVGKLLLTNDDFVAGSTGTSLDFRTGATTGDTYTEIRSLQDGRQNWGDLVLQRGGGNVGIGTDTISSKLQVDGGTLGGTANNTLDLLRLGGRTANSDSLRFKIKRLTNGGDWGSAAHKIYRQVDVTLMGFIQFGSKDSDLITFGENNNEYMRIDGSGKVGIGTTNPGATLEVANSDALIYGVKVGRGSGAISTNTAVGASALSSNGSGSRNTAVGERALQNNTTGIFNTAIGALALQSNTTSLDNTAVGYGALAGNTTGYSNTANGVSCMSANTTGFENTAVGKGVLGLNTTGSRHTAIGVNALLSNTTGSNNTAYGRSALFSNSTGSGNIGIGFLNNAGTYAPVFNPTTQNNRLVLGHTAITNAYVQVSWTVVSDERDKMNFAPVPYGLDFVNQLQPIAYQFKVDRDTEEPNGDVRYGFKAQDILALEGDNPVIIDTEDPERLKYKGEHLVPVLVNAVQELTTMVKDLQAEIAALKSA